ncbi:hypothetical protein G3I60_40005 [Streptomyces sp. SID13666]|uniref:hypothetical protein n=1 Tax=unclassified Streptomyces TaxID=2593676 RepID=UPI0013BEC02D|nr:MULTISPECIES: hypothetical protein [unclassified Streptomyces]MCZ4101300.1 hypothetical protein [Streptomyces sp. H39-C1]NEA60186.1 hypothetical protein [Streptomyces sp. SID13666]
MQKRFLSFVLPARGVGWSANRRVAVVAVVLTGLLAVGATAAWFSGRGGQSDRAGMPTPSLTGSASPSQSVPKLAGGTGSVPPPPPVSEPVAYAKAAAAMLWSYDTRDTSRDQQLAGMNTWMSKETQYADWQSIAAQVPDPVLWSRMADNDQHATFTVAEAHYPSAFKQALADDPTAITEAYIYVVTVNGKQQIAWKSGGSGAEDRAVSLAVQCRPSHDCSLVAIAPRVAP